MAQTATPGRPGRIIGEAGQRQVQLPLGKAFQIALKSIMVRFWRSMITAAGVLLGIAFLASTLAQSTITANTELPYAVNVALEQAQRQEAQARQIWLVTISLIVCTVGIANSMLMSVTERFKEIGTMKCLGALDGFIVKLFLLEAGVLGGLASVIGTCLGYGITVLLNYLRDGYKLWPKLPLSDVVTHFGFCILVGMVLTIVATIPPAIRASRLPPAAALRVEI